MKTATFSGKPRTMFFREPFLFLLLLFPEAIFSQIGVQTVPDSSSRNFYQLFSAKQYAKAAQLSNELIEQEPKDGKHFLNRGKSVVRAAVVQLFGFDYHRGLSDRTAY